MNKTDLNRGQTLPEVLMGVAMLAIILGGFLINTEGDSIRSNVQHSFEVAMGAQKALLKTCQTNRQAQVRSNLDADYFYVPSATEEDHVSRVLLGANCASDDMVVVLWTTATGADTDPIIELVAQRLPGSSENQNRIDFAWKCHLIKGEPEHLPAGCRNLGQNG